MGLFLSLLSQMFKSGFDFLKMELEHLHPEISDFSIDHANWNMQGIEYFDGMRDVKHYPPTFRWTVENVAWSYAPIPSFHDVSYKLWAFGSKHHGKEPYYGDEALQTLRQVVELSAQGKSSEEVNREMGFRRPPFTRRHA